MPLTPKQKSNSGGTPCRSIQRNTYSYAILRTPKENPTVIVVHSKEHKQHHNTA